MGIMRNKSLSAVWRNTTQSRVVEGIIFDLNRESIFDRRK